MSRRDRNTFSSGGYWRPADRTGRVPSIRAARDRAYLDHQPKQRGALARITKLLGGRR
ncbi:hypothetical protein HUF15_00780 [Streptomyces samsunensis]|uniref:hypothetical protein n=1 Tax=Streptomyces malaysiensis TaxID=92644 RepID=UPI0015839E61|nr:hypothetical protein [Streptomyces samsunensis]NUH35316.1 hypothetical protein [Streptomyces samsunensis]